MELVRIEVQNLRTATIRRSRTIRKCSGRANFPPSARLSLPPELFCDKSCARLPESSKFITQLTSDPLEKLNGIVSMHA